jgi:hypothetical protein
MVHGMVHGAWCMVHGAWCMVHGAWCMVHAQYRRPATFSSDGIKDQQDCKGEHGNNLKQMFKAHFHCLNTMGLAMAASARQAASICGPTRALTCNAAVPLCSAAQATRQ